MDALVDLLPLLFIGAYYLLAGRRRAQQKKAAREETQPQVVGEEPSATPFRSFLEQLEEAMAEASGQPSTEAIIESAPEPRLDAVLPPLPPREFQAPMGSFDSDTATDHDAHGFGRENPLSEEVFEQGAPFVEAGRRSTPAFDPHGLTPPRQSRTLSPWQKRLGDPKAARDAFVLQTVFGARGGRRRVKS